MIFKATLTVTVMLEAKSKAEVESELAHCDLEQIARECADGLWIGAHHVAKVERIPKASVPDELFAIGNDGSFFEIAGP